MRDEKEERKKQARSNKQRTCAPCVCVRVCVCVCVCVRVLVCVTDLYCSSTSRDMALILAISLSTNFRSSKCSLHGLSRFVELVWIKTESTAHSHTNVYLKVGNNTLLWIVSSSGKNACFQAPLLPAPQN